MFMQTTIANNNILNYKPLSLRDGSQKNTKLLSSLIDPHVLSFKTVEHTKKVIFIYKLTFSIQEKQMVTMAVKQDFL